VIALKATNTKGEPPAETAPEGVALAEKRLTLPRADGPRYRTGFRRRTALPVGGGARSLFARYALFGDCPGNRCAHAHRYSTGRLS
jgi:hypothetical protein